ncbi:uncharacterized protein LOC132027619 [Mustela nigripes]|uniref:uncharacterized protein LOC132027619 n=1 Tax=Mustela nigripes TaxID=77151 RepID=UPI00281564A5|nr:uncharacterized protein LOC132027619 [Mustela nigripes]
MQTEGEFGFPGNEGTGINPTGLLQECRTVEESGWPGCALCTSSANLRVVVLLPYSCFAVQCHSSGLSLPWIINICSEVKEQESTIQHHASSQGLLKVHDIIIRYLYVLQSADPLTKQESRVEPRTDSLKTSHPYVPLGKLNGPRETCVFQLEGLASRARPPNPRYPYLLHVFLKVNIELPFIPSSVWLFGILSLGVMENASRIHLHLSCWKEKWSYSRHQRNFCFHGMYPENAPVTTSPRGPWMNDRSHGHKIPNTSLPAVRPSVPLVLMLLPRES